MKSLSIPIWVKSLLIISCGLFGFELLTFPGTFSDAVQKQRADKAYFSSNYSRAIKAFEDLLARYPEHKQLTMKLGLSYYKQGAYVEALSILSKLKNEEFSKSEIKTLESAIFDMINQLNRSESFLYIGGVAKR
tara:strand:- start:1113 stop:1514 length:402 start_codon:yes stop_codon:yes gene_type:complete